jgi:vanillate/4-hydroxybenzoate decarboxylase subunit D
MSGAGQGIENLVCPRCRSKAAELRSRSPEAGVWTVFGCNDCFYTWRSTEPVDNTDPDHYPAVFRLRTEDLPKLQVAPAVPPLRSDVKS